jgi:CxxC motif-containing protein (DUF1111 family)
MKPRGAVGGGVLAAAALLLVAGCRKPPEPGEPLAGLTPAERAQFDRGREAFSEEFTPETGLGPLFNSNSCAECHEDPVPGGPGDEIEIHVAALGPDGVCDPLVEKGGPVIQQQATPALQAALGIDKEPVPEEAMAEAGRSTPDLLGFGLLDAVTDEAILARADADDRDGDGISGRPNRSLDGRLGRFGRKAFVPTLREFNDGAFVAEQGVTNPAVPTEETIGGEPIPEGVDPVPEPEIDQAAIDATDTFVRLLAPPAPLRLSAAARKGKKLFSRVGCDACHVPTLETGDNPVKALRYKKVTAYTDLLLHDMGPGLADICLGQATASEFRTEPLMGLRLSETFLHDGRTESVEEAIRLHGGEATASRDRFEALSSSDREAILEFLKSL